MLQVEELQCIMEEALQENGLRLPALEIQELIFAYLRPLNSTI